MIVVKNTLFSVHCFSSALSHYCQCEQNTSIVIDWKSSRLTAAVLETRKLSVLVTTNQTFKSCLQQYKWTTNVLNIENSFCARYYFPIKYIIMSLHSLIISPLRQLHGISNRISRLGFLRFLPRYKSDYQFNSHQSRQEVQMLIVCCHLLPLAFVWRSTLTSTVIIRVSMVTVCQAPFQSLLVAKKILREKI